MTAAVEIYTTPFCPYCQRAKTLLAHKGVAFAEIDVASTPGARDEMRTRTGGAKTVPQIFIDGTPIGGCDQLVELDAAGELDARLGLGRPSS